jgi:biopolymer transport protein ExbB
MHTILAAQQLFDIKTVFYSAPIIYSLLSFLSVASMGVWLYSLFSMRQKETMPETFLTEIRALLQTGRFEEAHTICQGRKNLLASLLKTGLSTREFGAPAMLDAMKSEGKRASTQVWQRLSLLNDVVIIAPMLGLLGTVIGMFYAFYDVNRSIESINALFDGLGIAVGTTVMGLVVAIVAMIFHATLKYRAIQALSLVENEALTLSTLMRR